MIEYAVERMAALIQEGKRPEHAALIAAQELGFTPSEVAKATAQRGAEIARRRREEARILTQEQARDFLRTNLSPRVDLDRHARKAAARVFFSTVTVEPAARNIVRDWDEAVAELDDDQWLIAANILYQLWRALPDGWDPRPPRRTEITRSSFMWPAIEQSAWWRWIPRG